MIRWCLILIGIQALLGHKDVGNYMVFSYLIGDERAGEALVIDPADDCDRLIAIADQHGLRINTILNTHAHVDHHG